MKNKILENQNSLNNFKPDLNGIKIISKKDLKAEIDYLFNEVTKTKIHPILAPKIVNFLPRILKDGVNILMEENDRLVYLISAISVLSGILPNVYGIYDGRKVGANLYTYIIGDYGSGKGAISYAKMLIEQIEKEYYHNYLMELEDWQKLSRKDKANKEEPTCKGIIIPANSSASAFIQILNENIGRGLLLETEGDTLAQTLQTEYGDYSTIIRNGFHHEEIRLARRGNKERISIKLPYLSIVLTGTLKQFLRLVPDSENGLFSRFLYLLIKSETEFRDVFNPSKKNYEEKFRNLGKEAYQIYSYLKTLTKEKAITFSFTKRQKEDFYQSYKNRKLNFIENSGEDASGVYHRLALINFRIAMVFSILKEYDENGKIPSLITCTDNIYDTAKYLTNELIKISVDVYHLLPERKERHKSIEVDDLRVKRVMELRKSKLSLRDIESKMKKEGYKNVGRSTIHNIIKKFS